MKKIVVLLFTLFLSIGLVACGPTNTKSKADYKSLSVTFVPSRDAATILEMTKPLENLLLNKLKSMGYDNLESVTVAVSSSYEAAGTALVAGTTDIAFLPGGTYVTYANDNDIEVILAATRDALSKDSEDPKVWNDGEATLPLTTQATYYRSIIIAGPSAKGQELAEKVNNGQALTWEDLNSAKWAVGSATSSAGTVFPSVWLHDNYSGKTVKDLTSATNAGGYGNSLAGLAAGTYDIVTLYADARRDYEANWTSDYGRETSIWEETNVIGVTPGIFNDTISVSNTTIGSELKSDLQTAFMELATTAEGKAIFAVYSHSGYAIVKDSDYDPLRTAQQILEEN